MSLFNKKKETTKNPLTPKKDVSLVSPVSDVPKKTLKTTTPSSQPKVLHSNLNNVGFRNILLQPIITEKATVLAGENNCYVFEVTPRANKISIKKAISEIYNFTPLKVNIVRIKGKKVRYGRSHGKTKNRKRALVFLKKGDHIEFVKK